MHESDQVEKPWAREPQSHNLGQDASWLNNEYAKWNIIAGLGHAAVSVNLVLGWSLQGEVEISTTLAKVESREAGRKSQPTNQQNLLKMALPH